MRGSGAARVLAGAILLALAVSALASCGSEPEETPRPGRDELPGPSPLARVAVESRMQSLDPLYASGRSERLASRQIYDPLVSRLDPPLGASGRRRGPARPLGVDQNGRDWRLLLRPGARFHDGSELNADAVRANVERWFASGIAEELLPELDAVDTPAPGQIRFQLSRPVPDLPARLGDPRLGLISPATLLEYGAEEVPDGNGGSGAYAPRVRRASRVVLEESANWWGRAANLGPGISRIELMTVRSPLRRVSLLQDGVVEIAVSLGPRAGALIDRRPLLAVTEQGGRVTGASAALRGQRGGPGQQPFSELWLTTLRE
jgi:peptide/nickel transport system substrate-binding protein